MGSPDEITPRGAAELPSVNEKIAVMSQQEGEAYIKPGLHINDEAGDLATQALAIGPANVELSKKVLRKIDLYILPFLCITYGKS